MRRALILAAALVASPAWAQSPAPQPLASEANSVDSASLVAGTRIAAIVMPDGTYRKMMSATFDKMMSSLVDKMGDVPLREMMIASGMKPEDVPAMKPDAVRQMMQIIDPAYKQRMDLGMKAITGVMTDMMTSWEPTIREGLAYAYARRFSAKQLGDIEAFFATPSGAAYASQSMTIAADPAVMDRMMALMPDIMKQMPKMIGAMTDATKELPPRRQYKDLTPGERARIADLLGVDPKKMKP